jgi:restriction system protein
MPEITRKRNGEIQRAIFSVLLEQPDAFMKAGDVLTAVAQRIALTPYELGDYASGGRRFEKIARFSTLAPVKAGWLLKQKGQWTVSDEGRAAYQEYLVPDEFARQASVRYQDWHRSRTDDEQAKLPAVIAEEPVADEAAAVRLEEAEESAWAEVEHYISTMNPYDFQDLVAALLRALGYYVVWTAPPGKDGGVDLIAAPDPLGTRLPRIKVQVKRQLGTVSVDGLRAFMATLGTDDVGLFVSTGGFTKDAKDEARQQSTRRVTLIDLVRLYDLWVEHYPKMPDDDRRRLPLRPVYFLDRE